MSILDVGAGFGKYGVLCREYLELWDGRYQYHDFQRRIDAVEVFADYITPVHRFIYNNVYTEDILTLIPKLDIKYDMVLLIDVLEHFEHPIGQNLLERLLTIDRKAKGVLVSTPKNPSPQKAKFGNHYEIHRARWTEDELKRTAKFCHITPEPTSIVAYLTNDDDGGNSKYFNSVPNSSRVL
jgi:hypothetical protein